MEYKIIQIISDIMEANCYLINYDNKTVIVDPCVNVNTLKKYDVKEVAGILITHCHVDHIFYLNEIINEYNATVYLSNCGLKMIYDDNMNLSNYFIKPLNILKDSFKYILLLYSCIMHFSITLLLTNNTFYDIIRIELNYSTKLMGVH